MRIRNNKYKDPGISACHSRDFSIKMNLTPLFSCALYVREDVLSNFDIWMQKTWFSFMYAVTNLGEHIGNRELFELADF